MYATMPFDFISATAWIDNNGGIDGYNLPYLPSYMSLAYIAHSNWFVALAAERVPTSSSPSGTSR